MRKINIFSVCTPESIRDDAVRQYVESSDCVILLGMQMTNVDMGANTVVLNPDAMITLSDKNCSVGSRTFSVHGLMLLPGILEKLRPHEPAVWEKELYDLHERGRKTGEGRTHL